MLKLRRLVRDGMFAALIRPHLLYQIQHETKDPWQSRVSTLLSDLGSTSFEGSYYQKECERMKKVFKATPWVWPKRSPDSEHRRGDQSWM